MATLSSKLAIPSPQTTPVCCMCGDSGLSSELFRCKVCQFRSQHRYCSNLYPKAEVYQVCNWCLSTDTKEKSQNSSNSSSSNKNSSEDDSGKTKKLGMKKLNQRGNLQLQVNTQIKKQRSPERSPVTPRRRLISNAKLEEKLIRRTKSEEIAKINSNGDSKSGIITKHVFRNKVRRYKLLEEVQS